MSESQYADGYREGLKRAMAILRDTRELAKVLYTPPEQLRAYSYEAACDDAIESIEAEIDDGAIGC